MPELHHLAPSAPPALLGEGDDALPSREQRHLTILLVARLVTGTGDALARVRNVSGSGMMLETSVPLSPGDAVRVELRSLQAVTGTVAWATPPRAGIQFDAPVDLAQLLHSAGATRPNAPVARAPRLATRCPVQLCHQGRGHQALLLDLSQGGGHVQGLVGARTGDQLGIAIPGMPARKAVVRWVRGDDAGFVFLEPIPFAQLAPWLQDGALRFGGGGPPA